MIGQALGCVDPSKAEAAEENGTVGNGVAGAGKQRGHEQYFALCNTDDNESVRGLVGSGGCSWLGTFGLPPVPPGEDVEEVRKR